jgi:hypothetical protein
MQGLGQILVVERSYPFTTVVLNAQNRNDSNLSLNISAKDRRLQTKTEPSAKNQNVLNAQFNYGVDLCKILH